MMHKNIIANISNPKLLTEILDIAVLDEVCNFGDEDVYITFSNAIAFIRDYNTIGLAKFDKIFAERWKESVKSSVFDYDAEECVQYSFDCIEDVTYFIGAGDVMWSTMMDFINYLPHTNGDSRELAKILLGVEE